MHTERIFRYPVRPRGVKYCCTLGKALFGKSFESKQTFDLACYTLSLLVQLDVGHFATSTWTTETLCSVCTRTFKSYSAHCTERIRHRSTRKRWRTHSSCRTKARRDEKTVAIQGESLEIGVFRLDSSRGKMSEAMLSPEDITAARHVKELQPLHDAWTSWVQTREVRWSFRNSRRVCRT